MKKGMRIAIGTAGALVLILALIGVVSINRSCHEKGTAIRQGLVPGSPEAAAQKREEARVEEKTFRPPVVRLPFTKAKPLPIAENRLPIPRDEVAKTIRIEVPGGKPAEIIIDKKGDVWKPLDAPKDIKVEVTKWKPKLVGFDFKFGGGVVFSKGVYGALSLDYLRAGRFRLGSDIGASPKKPVLIGLSLRYHVGDISLLGKWKIMATVGYTPIGAKAYYGITLRR